MSIQKLPIGLSFAEFVQRAILDNGFRLLPIEVRHTAIISTLPMHHRDPFDRLIVAQALADGLPLLSADSTLDA